MVSGINLNKKCGISLGMAAFILPFLILLTSYVLFFEQHNYSFLNPEGIWGIILITVISIVSGVICMVGGRIIYCLVIGAFITFFIDIQFNWLSGMGGVGLLFSVLVFCILNWVMKENFFKIGLAMFATYLTFTGILLIFGNDPMDINLTGKVSASVDKSLPRIIHIVVDEHIGLEGFPIEIEQANEIKNKLTQLYLKNDFQVFGGAYSHYAKTRNSVPAMLNFSATNVDLKFVSKKGAGWLVNSNEYFKELSSMGYAINVISTIHLQYCQHNIPMVANCIIFPHWDFGAMDRFDLDLFDKMKILSSTYLKRSFIYKEVRSKYQENRERLSSWISMGVPQWTWDNWRNMSALNSLVVLKGMSNEVLTLPPGNVLFGHILLPHSPYVTGKNCEIKKPIGNWENSEVNEKGTLRVKKYQSYFEQLQCLHLMLSDLFIEMKKNGIWDNSIIIIHGDHGSRLWLARPHPDNKTRVGRQDLVDGFSTFFAVKHIGKAGEYYSSIRPLEELLRAVFNDITLGETVAGQKPSKPFVYLDSFEKDETQPKELVTLPYSLQVSGPSL